MALAYPIEQHTLNNGLRIVTCPDHNVPIVAVNLWYDIGSRHEPAGLTGFAHLFEHLMFQGSRNVPEGKHFAWLQQAGATLNATTFFDRTNYFESLPVGGLELALFCEADRMAHLLDAVDQANLDNQRDVVKEEKRQRYDNQPYGDQFQRLLGLLFPPGHPYAHPTIGSMADLDAASLDDVHRFFKTYYGPNNAVISIVGDVRPDEAVRLVDRYFGDIRSIPQPDPAPDGAVGALSASDGTVPSEDVVGDVPSDLVTFGFRLPVDGTPELEAAGLALDVLVAGQSSRLNRELVRRRELAQQTSGGGLPLVGGVSLGMVTAVAYDEVELDDLTDALVEEVAKLPDTITDDEVATAKIQAERDWLESVATVAGRADALSHYACLFDDPDRVNRRVDEINAATPDEVRAAAATWLRPKSRIQVRYRRRSAQPAPGSTEEVA